jgi:hypothetical protein
VILPSQRADSTGAPRLVEGRIVRGTRAGPEPVANQWVILHRVGPDHAGPLDSIRTTARGDYRIRYHTSGDSTALYFVSTSYGGVAYFTAPLRAPVVTGDDGMITVFDTTSGPVAIKIGGRHLIVGAPLANGRRPVGEVYDLQNDSTVTAVPRDTLSPVWTAHLPAAAQAFQLNTNGELPPGAIARHGSVVGLFVPVSPGIRQVAFTYELPADAFPLAVPIERATGVLEILVQEPSAHLAGTKLREMAPVMADGRPFRRFLSQDVPANAVITVDMPKIIGAEREKVYVGVGVAVLVTMAAALLFAARRSVPRRLLARAGRGAPSAVNAASAASSPADELLRAIADLDAMHERNPLPDADALAAYESQRASLKAQLRDVLAARERPA